MGGGERARGDRASQRAGAHRRASVRPPAAQPHAPRGPQDADGAPLPPDARRKWCDVPANIEGAVFSPDHVYTFHCYQSYVNFGAYELNLVGASGLLIGGVVTKCNGRTGCCAQFGALVTARGPLKAATRLTRSPWPQPPTLPYPPSPQGPMNVDLAGPMHRSPMQVTVRDVGTGSYAVSLLMWHERALYGKATAAARKQAEKERRAGRRSSDVGGAGDAAGGVEGLAAAAAAASTGSPAESEFDCECEVWYDCAAHLEGDACSGGGGAPLAADGAPSSGDDGAPGREPAPSEGSSPRAGVTAEVSAAAAGGAGGRGVKDKLRRLRSLRASPSLEHAPKRRFADAVRALLSRRGA
jgi:hypothetical protein